MSKSEDISAKREQFISQCTEFWKLCDEVADYATQMSPRTSLPPYEEFAAMAEILFPEASSERKQTDSSLTLDSLTEKILSCTACNLCKSRTKAVPGEGVIHPRVMVIGEGPGYEEDKSGRPFVGESGSYLESWLASITLSRITNVYITNIVKCRPPQNRDPLEEEQDACIGYLERQIAFLKPEAILCAGRISAQRLLNSKEGVGKLRGEFHRYQGIPLLVTYHPSAVLRNKDLRRPVWEDMKKLAAYLGISIQR